MRQRTWKGRVTVSAQQFLSAATSFLHFCSTPEWTFHRPFFFFWNIHLFQQRVFHRLQWIICSAMEYLLLLLLSPWCYLWCLSPLPEIPPHSWLFLPFPECASTGDTGLADRLSHVLHWVHSEARWLWHGAHLGLVPQKSPRSFHLAHIYTQYTVLRMWCNNSHGCITPPCSSQQYLNKVHSHLWIHHTCSRLIYFCRYLPTYAIICRGPCHLCT